MHCESPAGTWSSPMGTRTTIAPWRWSLSTARPAGHRSSVLRGTLVTMTVRRTNSPWWALMSGRDAALAPSSSRRCSTLRMHVACGVCTDRSCRTTCRCSLSHASGILQRGRADDPQLVIVTLEIGARRQAASSTQPTRVELARFSLPNLVGMRRCRADELTDTRVQTEDGLFAYYSPIGRDYASLNVGNHAA